MTTRKKTILIALLILIVIAIIVVAYFLFFRKPESVVSPEAVEPEPVGLEEAEAKLQVFESKNVQPATPEESEYGQVKNLAASFAERYGSYSNQADFQNLIELKAQMTPSMQTRVDNFIAESRQNNPASTNYYAQTTRALSTQKIRYDATSGQAEFLVKCQRQEYLGSPENPRIYYQDLKITLVKIGDKWQVDSAYWQ